MMDVYHESVVGIPWQNIKTIYIDFPWDYGYHWHLEYEIVYVKKGRQRVILDKNMVELKEGEILIVAPGEFHAYMNEEGKSVTVIIVFEQIIFHNLGLSNQEKELFLSFFDKTQIAQNTYPKELKALLDDLCMKIHTERQEQKPSYIMYLHAYVYQFIMAIFRNLTFEELPDYREGMFKRKYNKLAPVLNYVAENYAQSITLEDATNMVHFSKYYFCKLFKEVTDTTFVNYLNGIRVSKAERELLNSKKTMMQISMDVGFSSVDSFNKAFKQFCKCTPSEYRKKFDRTI